MTDEEIKKINEDPNTWEWDGCTLPEGNPYSEGWEKDFLEESKKTLNEV